MRGDMGDMASPQGRGRQRDRTDVFADESQALDEIAKQAERALAARRQARYEARNIRMRELEKKAKEEAAEGGGTPHSVASPQSSLGHHNNSVNHNNSSHTPHLQTEFHDEVSEVPGATIHGAAAQTVRRMDSTRMSVTSKVN